MVIFKGPGQPGFLNYPSCQGIVQPTSGRVGRRLRSNCFLPWYLLLLQNPRGQCANPQCKTPVFPRNTTAPSLRPGDLVLLATGKWKFRHQPCSLSHAPVYAALRCARGLLCHHGQPYAFWLPNRATNSAQLPLLRYSNSIPLHPLRLPTPMNARAHLPCPHLPLGNERGQCLLGRAAEGGRKVMF